MKITERKLWTEQEDLILSDLVIKNSARNWPKISKSISVLINKPRSAKQCRERWCNYLDPSVKQSDWSSEDQDKVFQYNSVYGNKWSAIAALIPGRSENSVKNFYYSAVRKNIRRVNKLQVFPNEIKGRIDDLKKDEFLRPILFCNSKECLRRAKNYKRISEEIQENEAQDCGDFLNEWMEEYSRFILSIFGEELRYVPI